MSEAAPSGPEPSGRAFAASCSRLRRQQGAGPGLRRSARARRRARRDLRARRRRAGGGRRRDQGGRRARSCRSRPISGAPPTSIARDRRRPSSGSADSTSSSPTPAAPVRPVHVARRRARGPTPSTRCSSASSGCAAAPIPHMRARGGGRIINITSISVKQPIEGLVLSNALRAAVTGLAKTLALELAPRQHSRELRRARLHAHRSRRGAVRNATAAREGITADAAAAADRSRAIPLGRMGTAGRIRARSSRSWRRRPRHS